MRILYYVVYCYRTLYFFAQLIKVWSKDFFGNEILVRALTVSSAVLKTLQFKYKDYLDYRCQISVKIPMFYQISGAGIYCIHLFTL